MWTGLAPLAPTQGMAVSETCACCNHVCSLYPLSQTVTISPAVLTRPEGDKATFYCNISMENDSGSEYSLNWYKETNHSQAQKTAEISRYKTTTVTENYRLINNTPVFEIEILNLHQNDSGSYYCGLITFYEPDKVMESKRAQLIVTGQPRGQGGSVVKTVVCAGDGGYLWSLNHHDGVTLQKEEKPPVVFVSTVDYGVLEFQRDQHSPVPSKTQPVEQTEYATIIFPEEKPVTPERGKKHREERTRQLPSLPC
uniref:Ig-like domain-containing protein n=1 Tax=Zonotrichia albicollis TaxID=44394 RepID=A0A8D2ME49_ZONAL